MRFLHLSDLHLGKRVCEFSMLDDQRYILAVSYTHLHTGTHRHILINGDFYTRQQAGIVEEGQRRLCLLYTSRCV